jgi:hypothetical protein
LAADQTHRWLNTLGRVSSAPLFITVIGALLAGLIVPWIAAQAEDHRKARDIQTVLVQDVGQAVGRVTLTGQLIATRAIKKENANGSAVFDNALLQWESDRAAIRAQLDTYYAKAKVDGTPIPKAWARYSQAVEDLYYLSGTEVPHRCDRAKGFVAYVGGRAAAVTCPQPGWTSAQWSAACRNATGWDALALCDEDSLKPGGEGYVRGTNYYDAYRAAVGTLLADQEPLLQAVRKKTPAGF